ncbi:MAG: hypothetical protein HQL09_05915 [Nitrospirae bacterium]|nr:hypothetical protein [Nitrospirota bacterium]
MIGDSITQANPINGDWSSLLRTPVVNRGIIGFGLNYLDMIVDWLVAPQPSKVFIMIGINDIGRLAPDDMMNYYRHIISTIQSVSPKTRVYMQSVLPTKDADNNKVIIIINQKLKELCSEKGVVYINVYSAFLKGDVVNPRYVSDALHPNIRGYKVWANVLKRYFKPVVNATLPASPPTPQPIDSK